MFLICSLADKVVIGAELRLKFNYVKEKTDELGAEDDNMTDMKEATKKIIELAGNSTDFEGMRRNVKNKAVFGTFVNIWLVHFCSSMNWRYSAYNTVVSDIITESDDDFAMLLLENNVDDYKQLIDFKTKFVRKEAWHKYTKDPNINEKFKECLRKIIKRYNDLIKVVRLGRNTQVSKEMEIELTLKYARICGKVVL